MISIKTVIAGLAFVTIAANGLALASPQGEGAQGATKAHEKESESAKRIPPPPFTQRADYVVEPPDIIDISVEDTLPGRPIVGERLVRHDGTISIGWYGDLDVAGLTVAEIKKRLISKLQEFLNDEYLGLIALSPTGELVIDPATGTPKRIDPADSKKVRVEITQCNSKYFYVHGEVGSPGRYPITGTEGIRNAIKTAGGLSAIAEPKSVFLYRENQRGEPERLTVDVSQTQRGKLPSTDDRLKPGDRIVVGRRADAAPRTQRGSNQPSKLRPEDPSLDRLEKRLDELDHKLDRVLESIKRRRS